MAGNVNRAMKLLLGAFVALSLLYAWATPIFEASDELWHFGLIQHIAETGELPVQQPGTDTPWEQEGSQPPLYYLLAAALVKPVDRSDFDALRQPNPHAIAGIPGAVGNKNLVLHDTPHLPLTGTPLAVYLVRGMSILFGCVTVYAVYQSGRLVSNRDGLALAGAALTALNPMFLFITASANNDNLVTALNSLVIWQTLVLLRDGFQARRSVLIAVLVALATLTKLSGLVLIPAVGLAALFTAWRRRDWRGLVLLGGLMIAAWALLAGWWYARNVTLYGELFGTHMMAEVAGARIGGFTLATLLAEFQGFRFSYWALFGAVNIMTFRWFYDVVDILTVLAAVGVGVVVVRHIRGGRAETRPDDNLPGIVLLIGIVAGGAAGVINWTAQTYASQGRLLFPYVAAISPLLALGLGAFEVKRVQERTRQYVSGRPEGRPYGFGLRYINLAGLTVGLLGVMALVVPVATIAPAYAPPAPLDKLPDGVQGVYVRFGTIELIGYQTPDGRYAPGDTLPVTVYWRVIAPDSRDLSLYLHAESEDGTVIGKVDSYPGAGTLRTTAWQAGAIYADTYGILLDGAAQGASRLWIQAGWWHRPSEEHIPAQDESGATLASVRLMAGGFAGEAPFPADLTTIDRVTFGGVITLTGYRLADDHLSLAWEANGHPAADYTVFVQVVDETGAIVGQGDAPPGLPTHYWRAGDHALSEHTITYNQPLAAGTYRVLVGWYRPDDFTRLDSGTPDNAVVVTEIQR